MVGRVSFMERSDWHWISMPAHSWKIWLGIFIFRELMVLVVLALISSLSRTNAWKVALTGSFM